jgi:hypothetical protein
MDERLEIDIRIPLGYPETENISANCSLKCKSGSGALERKLNQELSSRIKERSKSLDGLPVAGPEPSQLSLFELISYCKETLERLEEDQEEVQESDSNTMSKMHSTLKVELFCLLCICISSVISVLILRLITVGDDREYEKRSLMHRVWIHSHHIYNRHKRKFLQISLGSPGSLVLESRVSFVSKAPKKTPKGGSGS